MKIKTPHRRRKSAELTLSREMVERVMLGWENEHPTQSVADMTADEFADRMMEQIMASAKFVKPPREDGR